MHPWKRKAPKPLSEEASRQESVVRNRETIDPAAVQTALGAWIEDRELSNYLLFLITAGAAYLIYLVFRPFLTALFTALILAIVFFPLYKWFLRQFRKPYVAALITTLLALVLVLVPFLLISARLVAEAANLSSSVVRTLGNPTMWPSRLNPLLEEAADLTGIPAEKLKADIAIQVRQMASWLLGIVASFGSHFGQQMVTIGLAFAFLFPLLRNGDEFRRGALSMLPLSRQRARELALAVNQGIVADIYGVVAVGIAEGMLIALGFWMAGLNSPLLWGAIASFLSCLPFVGVALVWMPACVILTLRGNWTNAILLFAWSAVVVSTAEGTIRSTVVSNRTRVNSMLIMLSIMGGVVAFGAIGIFVGPVLLVLVETLVRILREEHASAQASQVDVLGSRS